MTGHRIRWFARVQLVEGDRLGWLPRTEHMAGRDWGWDVRCSCGWETRTGGAIQQRIRDAIADHRSEVAYAATHPDYARIVGVRV